MNWKRTQFLSNKNQGMVTSSMTLNLNNSMSAAEINARINQLPKYIPVGKAITVQFADGTYTLDQTIYIANFRGGGSLYIYGNTSETRGLHSNQAVILDYVTSTALPVYVVNNSCATTVVDSIRINYASASIYAAIYVLQTDYCLVQYSYIRGNGITGGYGVYNVRSRSFVRNTYFDNSYGATNNYLEGQMILTDNGTVSTGNNQRYVHIYSVFAGVTGTGPSSTYGDLYLYGAQ